jgi:DNA invertase Pin-like site-specific DNA recombinase
MKSKVYGYCRVSTMKQSIERQIRNVKEKYPDAVIVTDEYTGTKLDRPGWTKLYKQLKPGDTVVFDQVSRMSRDADEGFRVYEDLFNLGVNLIFLKEPHINTSVYREAGEKQIEVNLQSGSDPIDRFGNGMIKLVNELLLDLAKEQIRLAFDQAEKEVEDLHQRTREGIETARLNGKQIGQPKGAKLTTKKSIEAKEVIRKRSKDFNGDLSDLEVMKLTGIARGTYYKYKRELKKGV